MNPPWLNPAGGLYYHVRAARFSKHLWSSFRFTLAEWLYAWQPPETKLVLVGPSGGYCFQPFFFERFSEVVCLEPDPVARRVFARRLARAPLETRPRLTFVSGDHLLAEPSRFAALLQNEGEAAVLFSNIIGQLGVLLGVADARAPELERLRAALTPALCGRSWASFHDRVSGEIAPIFAGWVGTDHRLSDAELISELYPGFELSPGTPVVTDGKKALLDHLTERFFPERAPHAYFHWELTPGFHHLIEATSSRRAEPAESKP